MKYLIAIFCIAAFSNAAFSQKTISEVLETYNSGSVPYMSVEELRRLQFNDKVTVLDARERKEFQVSYIPEAHFVGYSNFSVEKINRNLSKEDKIVIYCTLGVRSEQIAEKLKKVGYKDVYNLYGGVIEWKNKGYPLLSQKGVETDSVHTSSKYWGQWLTNGIKVYD